MPSPHHAVHEDECNQ